MKHANRRQQGQGGIELIEEATHLLRTAPAGALAAYYLGGAPFVLGLLYFWADMSRNPFAHQRLAGAALGMALLFTWMKFWQVVFARKLRAARARETGPAWNPARIRRVLASQATLQTTGLFLLPLSLIPALPFAWVYAFYQSLTALDEGETPRLRQLVRQAARQAALWPRQNHVALTVLLGFGVFVFLNCVVLGFTLPALVKMLFGVESVFTRSGESLLNTTFFAAMFGLTYLTVDPLVKAVYVLRSFYGESLESGEDLKAELKSFAAPPRAIAAMVILMLSPAAWIGASATESGSAATPAAARQTSPPTLAPPALDQAIQEVIQRNKYTWRVPREKVARPREAEQGIIERFLTRASETARRWARAVVEWLGAWLQKLFRSQRTVPASGSGSGWITAQQILLYALVALAGFALFYLLHRWIGKHRRPPAPVPGQPLQPAPDLRDENVGADHFPEDGWMRLAGELLERGELRLALRAFYLASLAHLAGRNLIRIAKFKSNRDYERELQRRGHAFAGLLALFGENVAVFDRVWYGLHEVTGDLVRDFAANVERIKAGG